MRRLGFLLSLLMMIGAQLAQADDFGLPKAATGDLKKLTLHVSQYHVVHAKPGIRLYPKEILEITVRPKR